jgi:hypothetical protein
LFFIQQSSLGFGQVINLSAIMKPEAKRRMLILPDLCFAYSVLFLSDMLPKSLNEGVSFVAGTTQVRA